ncbi:hypothetical protein RhiirA4_456701 [Rhizophagus irregularis]|uniref:Uncharacterized protein n=1 Tax=Rhizophagus irregularis TaxID=588596 RepID=A0A2I1G865_9GLOM|nr:hypothetical protein RhiirA4_456701 [Rhizophagus irregularis]
MASDINNKSQVDYLKVKQLINNLRDSSFLEFLKVGLKEYNTDNINEAHIVNTVKLTSSEDLTPYKALFSKFQDVFSTFEYQLLLNMDVAQIKQEVVQIDVLPVILKANATPFTPKGKGINPTSTNHKTSKKQPASIPAPKTISIVMIEYNLEVKNHVCEITKYTTVTMSVNLNEMAIDLWNEQERFQAVLIGVPTSTTIASLYLANPAHSILTPTGCKVFKLIQDKGTRKLITYYELWADLQRRNCHQKVKQDDNYSEVSQKNTNTLKSDKKHKETKRAKKIDKSLDSIDKFMVLADIRSMLRKSGYQVNFKPKNNCLIDLMKKINEYESTFKDGDDYDETDDYDDESLQYAYHCALMNQSSDVFSQKHYSFTRIT